ncbi:hypothetical protein TNCV_4034631 [Trichonephila clavipes]|nr:hypothetical protein TNCV_4034631 [Trichonephila clavipes]
MKDHCLIGRRPAKLVEISTSSADAILCDHSQSGCKICYQVFVSKTERVFLAVDADQLGAINVESGFL